jgi:hypothetical protein
LFEDALIPPGWARFSCARDKAMPVMLTTNEERDVWMRAMG